MKKSLSLRGFTLVELLVVMVIIAALASMVFVVGGNVLNKAKATKAKNHCTTLISAVDSFYADYQCMPTQNSNPEGDTEMKSDEKIMPILVNNEREDEEQKLNKKGAIYFSAENVTKQIGGLYMNRNQTKLFDPWGELYEVVLDTDFDGKIKDPLDRGRFINARSICFSKGKDKLMGQAKTNQDNVYSYK